MAGAVFTAIAHAKQTPGAGALPTGNGMIAGRVVESDSGEGIPAVMVQMQLSQASGAAGSRSYLLPGVLTDSQGRFVFTGLPDGTYFPFLERRDYAYQVLDRTIVLAAGTRLTDVNFRLTRLNAILGTVRDNGGDPVVGIEVLAFVRSVLNGRPAAFVIRGRGRTDDRGQYRINQLLAGQYFICACTRDVIPFDGQLLSTLAARPLDLLSVARRAALAGADAASLDSTLRTYAPTYYPNTPLASRAERVSLEKGEMRTGVDITAVTVRAVRVSGQIIGAPPSTISASSLRLVPVGDIPEAAAITQLPPVLVQADGRFDFGGVSPGMYTLEVNATPGMAPGGPSGLAMSFVGARGGPPPSPLPPSPGRNGVAGPPVEMVWASEPINVGDEDITGLVVGVQRGVTIRGKIEFSGAAVVPSTPTATGRATVQLSSMELHPGRPASYGAQLNPDFTFTMIVPPGRYVAQFVPSFAPSWTNVKAMTAKGADFFDAPLVVEGDIPDMVITLTDAAAPQIVGTLDLPAGEIPDEWAALIFTADRKHWKEPFGAMRRFNLTRVTAQGTFTARMPPGNYLLSMSRGIPLNWMDAPVLEELAKGATTLTLVEGDKKAVQVKR